MFSPLQLTVWPRVFIIFTKNKNLANEQKNFGFVVGKSRLFGGGRKQRQVRMNLLLKLKTNEYVGHLEQQSNKETEYGGIVWEDKVQTLFSLPMKIYFVIVLKL